MGSLLQDKIALVTGASRGIGRAVAIKLAEEGAHIIAISKSTGALEELDDNIKEKGGSATLLPMNLNRLDDVDKLGPTIAERFGKLDILVGNAGILGPLSPVGHISPQDWEKVMKLNFMTNVHLVRTLDPLLRQSKAGRIVFTTSAIADDTPAYWGPYAASKAALNAFVKTYAAETMDTNMRINALHPGAVDTKMMKEAFPGGPDFKIKAPEDVADDFLSLVIDGCPHHGHIIKLP